METRTVFLSVDIKAIFCLALMAILTNLVFTQNLYTSPLDDTRNALMSFSSGVSSSKPTSPPTKRPAVGGGWGWSRSKLTALLRSPYFVYYYYQTYRLYVITFVDRHNNFPPFFFFFFFLRKPKSSAEKKRTLLRGQTTFTFETNDLFEHSVLYNLIWSVEWEVQDDIIARRNSGN